MKSKCYIYNDNQSMKKGSLQFFCLPEGFSRFPSFFHLSITVSKPKKLIPLSILIIDASTLDKDITGFYLMISFLYHHVSDIIDLPKNYMSKPITLGTKDLSYIFKLQLYIT